VLEPPIPLCLARDDGTVWLINRGKGTAAGSGRPLFCKRGFSLSIHNRQTRHCVLCPTLADLLDEFSIVVCDDGGTEICDFLCVDQARGRVVMIHAKVSDTTMSLNSLQEVGRQAQAGLAFLTTVHDLHDRTKEWSKKVSIKDGHLTRRLLKGSNVKDAWSACRDAMRSARYTRDVWILAGRILERGYLVQQLQKKPPTPKVRQMTYYLGSLQTSAARANVGMRIFCSP
jgi:hypothetical protein